MTTVEALQRTLAAEHAAVHVLGVLGGQVSRSRTPGLFETVSESYRVHRGRRDDLVRQLRDLGAVPVAAEPAYALPNPVDTDRRIVAAGRLVEQRSAAVYAEQVARTTGRHRRWAVVTLTDAAVRQLRFQGSPEIFPGADELADR